MPSFIRKQFKSASANKGKGRRAPSLDSEKLARFVRLSLLE
jgi:hypothetical protein